MKKIIRNRKIVLIGILAAISLAIGIGAPVYARATVTKPLPWARLPAEDSGLAIDLMTYDEAWQIETPSGQVILIAHFDIPEEYIPDETIKNTGFLVTTWAAGNTYDTMCVVTPGGTAMLRAIIHP